MIKEESKNAIVSNVAEDDAVFPEKGVQIILDKIFEDDKQR